jgi:hypothetical protein
LWQGDNRFVELPARLVSSASGSALQFAGAFAEALATGHGSGRVATGIRTFALADEAPSAAAAAGAGIALTSRTPAAISAASWSTAFRCPATSAS